jgi:hypothetical protein
MDISLKVFEKPSVMFKALLLELISFILNGSDPENGQSDGRKEYNKEENSEELTVLTEDQFEIA